MIRKSLLAMCTVAAFALAGANASEAEAGGCYRGGGYAYGAPRAAYYGGYGYAAPRHPGFYRGYGYGPSVYRSAYRGYGYPYSRGYGYGRGGVSIAFGF